MGLAAKRERCWIYGMPVRASAPPSIARRVAGVMSRWGVRRHPVRSGRGPAHGSGAFERPELAPRAGSGDVRGVRFIPPATRDHGPNRFPPSGPFDICYLKFAICYESVSQGPALRSERFRRRPSTSLGSSQPRMSRGVTLGQQGLSLCVCVSAVQSSGQPGPIP